MGARRTPKASVPAPLETDGSTRESFAPRTEGRLTSVAPLWAVSLGWHGGPLREGCAGRGPLPRVKGCSHASDGGAVERTATRPERNCLECCDGLKNRFFVRGVDPPPRFPLSLSPSCRCCIGSPKIKASGWASVAVLPYPVGGITESRHPRRRSHRTSEAWRRSLRPTLRALSFCLFFSTRARCASSSARLASPLASSSPSPPSCSLSPPESSSSKPSALSCALPLFLVDGVLPPATPLLILWFFVVLVSPAFFRRFDTVTASKEMQVEQEINSRFLERPTSRGETGGSPPRAPWVLSLKTRDGCAQPASTSARFFALP